ncbi:hypothetical protein [Streptomyces aurantiogriseus]|uniref:hypothetical protein n=1 Tax=Streptomyces aurantiogriseus TaxID=66870 RepID=UPI001E2D8EF5|nr:hypothetical protein [Streptomyces aurantiogriseus]
MHRSVQQTRATTSPAPLPPGWAEASLSGHGCAGPTRRHIRVTSGEKAILVSGLLAEAAEQGAFRAVEPRPATLQFLNLHHHTYQWVEPDGRWEPAFLSREYCATLFRGFGASDSAVPDVEERVAAFKRNRPELPPAPRPRGRRPGPPEAGPRCAPRDVRRTRRGP